MSGQTQVNGYCDAEFERVQAAFTRNLASGDDVGASFAVNIDGRFVVDLWGGYADAEQRRPWEKDTIVNTYSTTKTMTTLCVMVLVDRGQIDLDAPVALYWPQFAQNGKEKLPVRYLLSHQSGLAGWEEPVTMDTLYNWTETVALLAAQKPWWQPGQGCGYHAVTYGYLLGEVVRRVTGKSLGTFFREEIAVPLGVDFHIGFGAEIDPRVADMIPPPPDTRLGDITAAQRERMRASIPYKVFTNPVMGPELLKDRAWRAAEIPASNGHGNARAVAKANAILAGGGELEGKRFFSVNTLEKFVSEQCYYRDLVLDVPVRWGLGYALNSPELPVGPNARAFWWGGYGGSRVVIDREARLCCAYVMNKIRPGLTGDRRSTALLDAVYQCL